MKAVELKNRGVPFKLSGKTYQLKLNMNTFCELEDVYGDLNLAFEDLQKMKIKAIRALVYAAIKVEDDTVTLKAVGEEMALSDLEMLGTALTEELSRAMPEIEDSLGEAKAT